MSYHISEKTIYIVLGIFIFVILITIGVVRTYYYWTSVQYFGEILEINNGNLLLRGDRGAEIFVLINKDTAIRRGKSASKGELQVGNYVVIVGDINREGFIEARVIRVLKAPPPRK